MDYRDILRELTETLEKNEIDRKDTVISQYENRKYAEALREELLFSLSIDNAHRIMTESRETMLRESRLRKEIAELRRNGNATVRGHWIEKKGGYDLDKCSICGWQIPCTAAMIVRTLSYCPNCGALMTDGSLLRGMKG